MAFEIVGQDFSREASADLSASQFLIVNLDASSRLQLAGAGEYGWVLQNKPSALGNAGSIRLNGITKVVTGAAVAIDDLLTADAAGKAVTAAATDKVIGKALETSTALNEVVAMAIVSVGAA